MERDSHFVSGVEFHPRGNVVTHVFQPHTEMAPERAVSPSRASESSEKKEKTADPLDFTPPPSTPKNPFAPEIAQLEHRRSLVRLIQEDERGVLRQRAAGKLTVRERIDGLIDKGSWKEFGSTASPKGWIEWTTDGSESQANSYRSLESGINCTLFVFDSRNGPHDGQAEILHESQQRRWPRNL